MKKAIVAILALLAGCAAEDHHISSASKKLPSTPTVGFNADKTGEEKAKEVTQVTPTSFEGKTVDDIDIQHVPIGTVLKYPGGCIDGTGNTCNGDDKPFEVVEPIEAEQCVVAESPMGGGLKMCRCFPKGDPSRLVGMVKKSCNDGNGQTLDVCLPETGGCLHAEKAFGDFNKFERVKHAEIGDILADWEDCPAQLSFCDQKAPDQLSYAWVKPNLCKVAQKSWGKGCDCIAEGTLKEPVFQTASCEDGDSTTANICTDTGYGSVQCLTEPADDEVAKHAIICIAVPNSFWIDDIYGCSFEAAKQGSCGGTLDGFKLWKSSGIYKSEKLGVFANRWCSVLPASATSTHFVLDAYGNGTYINGALGQDTPIVFWKNGVEHAIGALNDIECKAAEQSGAILAPKGVGEVCEVMSKTWPGYKPGFLVTWR